MRDARPLVFRALLAVPISALLLASCSATSTLINKSNLDVQTHMSETVFLDPVPERLKTIYVGVRNTSDHPEIDLRAPIIQKLQERGYAVVRDPDQAHYLMQLNVLQAGPIDPRHRDALLGSNYGAAVEGLALGAAAGGITQFATGNTGAAVGVGLGVAAASYLADQFVKDVYYSVTTDIQIGEKPLKGGKVSQSQSTSRNTGSASSTYQQSQGVGASEGVSNYNSSGSSNSNSRTQSYDSQSDYLKYNVRSVAYANQVNLRFEAAEPLLIERLSSSVANLYE